MKANNNAPTKEGSDQRTTQKSSIHNDNDNDEEEEGCGLYPSTRLVELERPMATRGEGIDEAAQQPQLQLPNSCTDKTEDMNQRRHHQDKEKEGKEEAQATSVQAEEKEEEMSDHGREKEGEEVRLSSTEQIKQQQKRLLDDLDQQDRQTERRASFLETWGCIEPGGKDLTMIVTPEPQLAARTTTTTTESDNNDQTQQQERSASNCSNHVGGSIATTSLLDHFSVMEDFAKAPRPAPAKYAGKEGAAAAPPPPSDNHVSSSGQGGVQGLPPPPAASAAPSPDSPAENAATAVIEQQDVEVAQFLLSVLPDPIPEPLPQRASLPGAFPVNRPLSFGMTTSQRNAPGVLTVQETESGEQEEEQIIDMTSEDIPIAAELRSSHMEDEIRDRIINEAVQATSVVPVIEASEYTWTSRRHDDAVISMEENRSSASSTMLSSASQLARRYQNFLLLMGGILILAIILMISLVVVWERNSTTTIPMIGNSSNISSMAPSVLLEDLSRPTIDLVRERGFVRCGVDAHIFGVSRIDPETGRMEGLNVEYVRLKNHCACAALPVLLVPTGLWCLIMCLTLVI